MTEFLTVRSARKSFGAKVAVRDVSFELRAGEMLGLLGPNGAGKTTLIRALCGRVALDDGTISLRGEPLAADSDRSGLGYVPQELALYSELSARENLQIFGHLHGVAGQLLVERVEQALEWIGLADRASDEVRTFSGGMKRRVNIACGVLHRPDVVLLDEPTVGVDPQSRERIFAMLAELRDRGAAVLLTTHQLDDAETRCDRLVVIDHGRVIAEGTVSEMLQSTVGADRRAIFRLDRTYADRLDGFSGELDARSVSTPIRSVADDLPRALRSLHDAGYQVEDVHLQTPNLQTVFLHLTGRELRE